MWIHIRPMAKLTILLPQEDKHLIILSAYTKVFATETHLWPWEVKGKSANNPIQLKDGGKSGG